MGRILLAGLIGGIAMFMWSSLAHTALPIGDASLKQVSETSAIAGALQAELGDRSGLYAFPGVNGDPHGDEAAAAALAAKVKTGASGLIVYHGPGRATDMGPFIAKELALEIVQGVILAFVLAGLAIATLGRRVLVAVLIGVAVGISTNGSNAIWWGFPMDYTLSAIVIQLVGYSLAGVVAAFILGWKKKAAA